MYEVVKNKEPKGIITVSELVEEELDNKIVIARNSKNQYAILCAIDCTYMLKSLHNTKDLYEKCDHIFYCAKEIINYVISKGTVQVFVFESIAEFANWFDNQINHDGRNLH
jgi:phage-related holin